MADGASPELPPGRERLIFVSRLLVGYNVEVTLTSGAVYEGVFHTVGAEVRVDQLDPVLKARGSNWLKLQCFQANGLKHQPAPLRFGIAQSHLRRLCPRGREGNSFTHSLPPA